MNLYIIRKNNVSNLETFFKFDEYIIFLIFDNIISIYILFLEFKIKVNFFLKL